MPTGPNMGKSFHDLLTEALPKLRRFTAALTGNLADGDDLLQSAIERALKKQATFNPELKFESWIFKIAQNIWIDTKRAEARRGVTVDIEESYALVGEDGTKQMEQRQMTNKVMAAISSLPDTQRVVVAEVLLSGRTYQEAADSLDVPVGTVMSRLSRARKILEQKVLGKDLEATA
jgi:RNA polymerase sigma-70 factor (ECF subfamily)